MLAGGSQAHGIRTNSAETKFANDTSPFSCHCTSVLDARWLCFLVETGELELSLISNMGRELCIAGDIEIRPAQEFVVPERLPVCHVS